MTHLASAALIAGLFGLAAPAPPTVDLAWKYKAGQSWYQRVTTETAQTMTVMGNAIEQSQSQEFVFRWTVKEVGERAVEVEQSIESVKVKVSIGGNEIAYDSDGKGGGALAPLFKALVGTTFKVTLDPRTGQAKKVAGVDDFLGKLPKDDPTTAALMKQLVSEEQMKVMAEPAFTAVPPTGRAKRGDAWKRVTNLDMGPIGSYETTYDYTYVGLGEKDKADRYRIDMTAKMKYKAPEAGKAGGLPFSITGGELEAKESAGTLYFDARTGRTAEAKVHMTLEGKLKIDIGGMATEVDLKQRQTTTSRTFDKNPNKP